MKKVFVGFLILGLVSCSGAPELKQEDTVEIQVDSSDVSNQELEGQSTIPLDKSFKLKVGSYEVAETLASIQSEDKSETFNLVITTDAEVILERSSVQSTIDEAWEIILGDINEFGFEAKFQWMDADKDGENDELVILWNTMNGTSGMLEGYEMERQGIIVFDVQNRNELANFKFVESYLSYSAADDANTEDDDYHAKMADDSNWDICSFSHTVEVKNNQIHVSDPYFEHEGNSECYATIVNTGAYSFNSDLGIFELKK
jgi:hypothetical protein